MQSSIIALIAASVAHVAVGALVVRSYLRSAAKLKGRLELILVLLSGPYGWILLKRYYIAKSNLKKFSKREIDSRS